VIAIAGGLGAAVSWAIATAASSRSSRMIGPTSVLAWVMIVGLVVTIPPAVLTAGSVPSTADLALLLVYGGCYTAGLLIAYRALTVGRVAIVTPITSTEGAVAAIIAVLLGETLSLPMAATLALIVCGVILSSIERDPGEDAPSRLRPGDHPRQAVALAATAAVVFGIGLAAGGVLGDRVPFTWIVMSARIIGTVAIAVPLWLRGGLRLTRQTAPLVVISGTLEALGSWAYVVGAHDSIAVAAVLGSQFAVIASLIGYFAFHERLARAQVAGVVLTIGGVTVLALLGSAGAG
jgi:drug/metabolite transporter (DMT)-like permease